MAAKKTASDYQALETRLVLASWFQDQLGYRANREMLEDLAQAEEGFDAAGGSYLVSRLISRSDCALPADDLARYDANIQIHLAHINRRRTKPIVLRYFQHLSLLATELYLDRISAAPRKFVADLNSFVRRENTKKPINPHPEFSENDLNKLAFWMATGSGKTLLFHFHYLQFLNYRPFEVENVLLVTPNTNLTEQHLAEMAESDLPCERFQLSGGGLGSSHPNAVRVIEITKLVEEKKGGGESVPIEYFEGKNLVFVDEGHKGTGSLAEAFRRRRQLIAGDGFTFEYSATFGQALDASKRDEVTVEYAKAILFDYSYRYFYGDGFGKNFHILNLKETTDEEAVDTLLLGNLLSFFEQRLYFADKREEIRPYGLDPPLWLLVGSRVTTTNSDTLRFVQFLGRFLRNERGWSEKVVGKIFEGKSGIITTEDGDLFTGHLNYLRERWGGNPDGASRKEIYHAILGQVFNAGQPGELEILTIGASKEEVGLRVSGCDDYFGLVYVSKASEFAKKVAEQAPDLKVGDDAIVNPLFPTVKHADSAINLLVGAKKFMEGWSSWRVSNMGLLNVGRSEGSEIIQLFGRGVRLRGWQRLLKRSEALSDLRHPDHIALLETLNIFAIRANYMANFKAYLEREGLRTDGYATFHLDVLENEAFIKEGLLRPQLPRDRSFADEVDVVLMPDRKLSVKVDMTTRVRALHGGASGGVDTIEASGGERCRIPTTALNHIDWAGLHLELVDYAAGRGFRNLVIPYEAPRLILEDDSPLYELTAPESWLTPDSSTDASCLREVVLSILRKYIDRFYRTAQQRWESEHMVLEILDKEDDNFQPYQVSVAKTDFELVREVEKIIEEAKKAFQAKKKTGIYAKENQDLPNLIFDRHLYQPLLIAKKKVEIRTSPKALEESERVFVEDLRNFCEAEKEGVLKGKQLFLLRNLGRGKGIGFFDDKGFYPDFILWMKKSRGKAQRIIFVEPHGMLLGSDGPKGDKLQLHKKLQEHIAPTLEKAGMDHVTLDAFIVSSTPFSKLHKKFGNFDGVDWTKSEFARQHVLFQEKRNEDSDYVREICRWET